MKNYLLTLLVIIAFVSSCNKVEEVKKEEDKQRTATNTYPHSILIAGKYWSSNSPETSYSVQWWHNSDITDGVVTYFSADSIELSLPISNKPFEDTIIKWAGTLDSSGKFSSSRLTYHYPVNETWDTKITIKGSMLSCNYKHQVFMSGKKQTMWLDHHRSFYGTITLPVQTRGKD